MTRELMGGRSSMRDCWRSRRGCLAAGWSRSGGCRMAVEGAATGDARVALAFVLGIVSVRGEIVTLLDLASMIGLRAMTFEGGAACAALLLGLPGLRSGLVVDEVLGVERYTLNNLQPSLSGREFARGVEIRTNTVLLDLELLFGSGRFTISDEA